MKVEFKESFARDLKSISNRKLLTRIQQIIEAVEASNQPSDIHNLKKLKANGNYFRIRIGDYRLGLIIQRHQVTFVRCLSRKEIYRFFP